MPRCFSVREVYKQEMKWSKEKQTFQHWCVWRKFVKDKKNEGLPHRTDNGTFRQAVERAVELTSDRAALDFSTLDIVEES